VPDGEPRVFEDPDKPGKYRAYIIGSHDFYRAVNDELTKEEIGCLASQKANCTDF
jgi:hypothetical protein